MLLQKHSVPGTLAARSCLHFLLQVGVQCNDSTTATALINQYVSCEEPTGKRENMRGKGQKISERPVAGGGNLVASVAGV